MLFNLRLRLGTTFASAFAFFFFFFFYAFERLAVTVHALCMNSSRKVFLTFSSQSVHTMYCLWTHKFHFSATFSLKIWPDSTMSISSQLKSDDIMLFSAQFRQSLALLYLDCHHHHHFLIGFAQINRSSA